jgi:hypothetical protein
MDDEGERDCVLSFVACSQECWVGPPFMDDQSLYLVILSDLDILVNMN